MEGRKESKYRLSGTCPECGKLIAVEHIIAVDLVEQGTSTKVEEEPNGKGKGSEDTGTTTVESSDVRFTDEKGPAGTASVGPKPGNSKKSKRAKKAGGAEQ